MFRLSPNQFNAMNERTRVKVGLAGLSGFASGVEARGESGAVEQTFFGPVIGSGLTDRRPREALSRDQLDFSDHSISNLPVRTRLPGSNIRPGAPSMLSGFRGLGRLGFELTQLPVKTSFTTSTSTPVSLPGQTVAYANEKLAAEAAAKIRAQNLLNAQMHINAITALHKTLGETIDARKADMNSLQSGGIITTADIQQVQKNVATGLDVASKLLANAQTSFKELEATGETALTEKARPLVGQLEDGVKWLGQWQNQLMSMKATPTASAPPVPSIGPAEPFLDPASFVPPSKASNNTTYIVVGIAAVALGLGVVLYRS